MTAEEYLSQAYRLNNRINAEQHEADNLRRLATSLPSPALGDKVMTSWTAEAPFVGYINRLVDMERDINAKIDRLINLRDEIACVIDDVPDDDARLVLHLRYLAGYTWDSIAKELAVSNSTVRRWHKRGLQLTTIQADGAAEKFPKNERI